MNEEALSQLSREDLIVPLLQYRERMEAREQALEAKLDRLIQPAKTSANSSLPPSTGKKATRSGRMRVELYTVMEWRVERCEKWGVYLIQEAQRAMWKSQVVELLPMQAVVEAQRYGWRCPQCGRWQTAAYAEGMELERVFRRRLEAWVIYLCNVANVMGEAQPQVWVSGLWSAQLKAPARNRRLSLVHQLRDLHDADRSAWWAYGMQLLLRKMMPLADYRERLSEPRFPEAMAQLEACLDALIRQWASESEEPRLHERLHCAGTPAYSNASDLAQRDSVIHRKVISGNRSFVGTQTHATVASVVDTAHERDHDVMKTISRSSVHLHHPRCQHRLTRTGGTVTRQEQTSEAS